MPLLQQSNICELCIPFVCWSVPCQSQVNPTDFNASPPAGIKLETPCFLSNVKMSMSSCSRVQVPDLISAFLGSMLIGHGITLFLTPLLYGTLVRPFQQIMYQQSLSFRVLGSAKTWFQDHGRAIDHQQISGDIVPRGYDVRIWLFRGSSPKQHVRNPQIVARSAKEIYWNESNLGQVQGFHA